MAHSSIASAIVARKAGLYKVSTYKISMAVTGQLGI